MEDTLGELVFLRLNVMPPYTYDGDEGQRAYEEFTDFYSSRISEAIAAAKLYLDTSRLIAKCPGSDEVFAKYLNARRRFIASLPFCEDEFPDESSTEYNSSCEFLRSYFVGNYPRPSIVGDLESMDHFHNLLVRYQAESV